MTTTSTLPRREPPEREAPDLRELERRLRFATSMVDENPECLDNPMFLRQAYLSAASAFGGNEQLTRDALTRGFLHTQKQRNELVSAIRSLKGQKPVLAWVTGKPFTAQLNGRVAQYVFAMPLGREAVPSGYYEVIDQLTGPDGAPADPEAVEAPDPPFLGLVDPQAKAFLGSAVHLPAPPLPAQLFTAEAARVDDRFDVGEIQVSDGPERQVTLFASKRLARQVDAKLQEGETVTVRAESGIATAIANTEHVHEDWLEFPSLEGPGLSELVFPYWLRQEWKKDVLYMAGGRPVRVVCTGQTGCGKTEAAIRCGREVARKTGRQFALIRVSPSHIGSSYIHQTERNMFRALKRARGLARRGFVVVVLVDEADALFGEGAAAGAEHSHNRSERLQFQSLTSEDLEGVAIYLTMNPRKHWWLPPAINRRFRTRSYPRPSRSQLAAVAATYVEPEVVDRLGLGSSDEFGGVFADNLFSDDRVVGAGRLHSGETLVVRARDLLRTSAGKVEQIVKDFSRDLELGLCDGAPMDYLWAVLDREFKAPELNTTNFFDVTFLDEPATDVLRTVDVVG